MKAAILPIQIKTIHAIKTRTRLDEASYRAMLQGFGAASSKTLTREDADRLIARMRDIPGAERPKGERVARAEGRYAGKLRALWISGWNLALIEDRSDAAMHAFVERQTGIPHTRFLHAARDAQAAIEGLKGWLERAGGVDWPASMGDGYLDAVAAKRAVLRAQWRRLTALGFVKLEDPSDPDSGLNDYVSWKTRGGPRRIGSIDDATVTADELDTASAAAGRWLRTAIAKAGVSHARG